MISLSDNTATDHLIRLLGRKAVERQQRRFDMAHPGANEPFLTTREVFQLKMNACPSLAEPYEGLDREGRRSYLSKTIDPLPLPALTPWVEPRAIDSIGWFASASDICRAFSGLSRQAENPDLSGVGHALSINDGGVGLRRDRWQRVWFKGGSEPGVLTLNYLATTTDGETFVVSAMASNAQTALDQVFAVVESLALIVGAFDLAAR
jgi:Beta-lactamase enzyme family